MAKSTPIPSFKRPTAMPVSAMAAFVSGTAPSEERTSPASEDDQAILADSASTSEPLNAEGQLLSDQATVHSIDGKMAKPRAKVSQAKNGRRLESRKDGTVSRKVTFYLDPDMDTQLSMHSVTTGVDRSDIIADALTKFFRRSGT